MQLELADGRTLEVTVTGPVDGAVLVHHHGTPGSALVSPTLVDAAARRGMRLVAWSRPGYGSSTRRARRTVADVVTDAVEVLDRLGVGTALTSGESGGGPHALACGALRPDRFTAVASIVGVAPHAESAGSLDWFAGMGEANVEEFSAALRGEAAVREFLVAYGEAFATIEPAGIVEELDTLLPEVDRRYITADYGEHLAATFRHAVSRGIDGIVDDDLAFAAPWGFDLGAVRVPVHVWQGTADLMVPFAHGQWLVGEIPHVVPHLMDGEGHLSIGEGHVDDILDALLGGPDGQR